MNKDFSTAKIRWNCLSLRNELPPYRSRCGENLDILCTIIYTGKLFQSATSLISVRFKGSRYNSGVSWSGSAEKIKYLLTAKD